MCGINGLFRYGGLALDSDKELVGAMNDLLRHRGPDDTGTWSNDAGSLSLGHCRLSIIDLSPGGHQPMVSPPGNTIVFNGEIYNYKELKKQLPGYSFRSTSDTEVLLALYEKKGTASVEDLKGMFAFGLWDESRQQLFLARDPVGKKPLYYTERDGKFAFSSEIRSLLVLPWLKPELDEKALYHFLTYNLLPPPLTMFRNVFKFHPGYRMVVNSKGIASYEKYWEVSYAAQGNRTEPDLQEETFVQLKRAVSYRMVSDVPVGAFLSGGVDSSAIVALMSKMTDQPVKTYSIGFENQPGYDELVHARSVSKMFGTDHYEKIVTEQEITDGVRRMAGIFDEPLADATCIPIYFISEKAREKGSKVVLTGDGSDELFAGYRSYSRYMQYYPLFRRWSALPALFRQAAGKAAPFVFGNSPLSEMFYRAAHSQEFFQGGARSFKESVKDRILSPGFRQRAAGWDSYEVMQQYHDLFNSVAPGRGDLDWMCFLGFKFIDPNLYLYRADKLGMTHSIELRAPFLDTDLVNFALSLPAKYKIAEGEPKHILKKSLERILPREVLYRKKMGFCVPLREWAGGMMAESVDDGLESFCRNTGLFDEKELRKTVSAVRIGNSGSSNDLFTIYFLMAWFDKWLPAR